MRSFQNDLPAFDARGVKIVAISVDPPEVTREHARKQGYSFLFLSDPAAETIRRYDLLHEGAAPGGGDIARPAEFLIDASGMVRWTNITKSYADRTRPSEVLGAVDSLGLGVPR